MNIAFMTTVGVNVGDEFIRLGIQNILRSMGIDFHSYYVNKHDPDSIFTPIYDEPETMPDKFAGCDVFIQAGAPVYWNLANGQNSFNVGWYNWLWRDRVFAPSPTPMFLNLGAGSCMPLDGTAKDFLQNPDCVMFTEEAFKRAALTTVRDSLACDILTELGLDCTLLPCPAFLAACSKSLHGYHPRGPIGVNLMALGGHYDLSTEQDLGVQWEKQIPALLKGLRKGGPLMFIAHDEAEYAFQQTYALPGERVFHSRAWEEYLDAYAACSRVVANRVHGAVVAASFGIPATIIGNDSRTRIGWPIELDTFRVGAPAHHILDRVFYQYDGERDRLLQLRRDTMAAYRALLEPIISLVQK